MKLTVSFEVGSDGRMVQLEHEFDGAEVIRGVEVQVDGMPIIRMPFHIHGPRYHTICSRINDDVREVDW